MSDPINGVPDHQRELFQRFSRAADGFSADDVVGAAINMLINAIRQSRPDWRSAEMAFDEYLGTSKQILKNHYDALGRKRGIFPYDQVISVDIHRERRR